MLLSGTEISKKQLANDEPTEITNTNIYVSFPLQGELVAPHVTLRGPLPGPGHVIPM